MNTFFINKRVIVTGGAGFIGSHIAEELIKQGSQVVVMDDLSTGSLKNIEHFSCGKLEFVRGSVTDISLLRKYFTGADFVFHQAAIASVTSSVENPLSSHETNLTGTLNILQISRETGIKKVVCASSCAIYGNEPTLPKQEDMSPDPQSPYAVTKLAMEYYCRVYQRVYALPTVCLRYFNVYGPRQDPSSEYAAVIPKFIQRVKAGKPPIIFGDGGQTRDFVFVKDVVAANLSAAESDVNGVFNIGTGESIDLNTLADMVSRLTGNKIEPFHDKPRPGDIMHSAADITKARAFGFKPQFDLQSGLKETLSSKPYG